jgi:hypothetical protein
LIGIALSGNKGDTLIFLDISSTCYTFKTPNDDNLKNYILHIGKHTRNDQIFKTKLTQCSKGNATHTECMFIPKL